MSDFLTRIVSTALTFERATEDPKTPNMSTDIAYFQRVLGYDVQPQQWCALFVSAVVAIACRSAGVKSTFDKSTGAVRLAHKNPDHVVALPAPGVIFTRVRDAAHAESARKGGSHPGHTGILVRLIGGTVWETIEGNTVKSGENDNGGGCFRKTFDITDPRLVALIDPTPRG